MVYIVAMCLGWALQAAAGTTAPRLHYPQNAFENRAAAIAMVMAKHEPALNESTPPAAVSKPFRRVCNRLPARGTPSTNVSAVHACDVEVIAAIGDSLTTGDQARSTNWLNLRQYPGLAWSIGGDLDASSVPRLFEQSCGRMPEGPSTGNGNGAVLNFNYAISGAVVQDIPRQASTMITGLKAELGGRYDTAWKLISLLIGGNNLCLVCEENRREANNEVVYGNNLRESMTQLASIPNAIISIVLNLDYTQLAPLVTQFGCRLIMPSVCGCLGVDDEARLAISREYIKKYNVVIVNLVEEFNRGLASTNTRFVAQPFAVDTTLASKELISAADCFHPSAMGQGLLGRGLWLNLFEKVGEKRTEVFFDDLVCPDENSVFGV